MKVSVRAGRLWHLPWDGGKAGIILQLRHSVVFKLMASLVIGGICVSAGLSVLGFQRINALGQMQITQQAALTTRNMQTVLRGLFFSTGSRHTPTSLEIHQALGPLLGSSSVVAARIKINRQKPVVLGPWPTEDLDEFRLWPLSEYAVITGTEIDLERRTLIQAPFRINRQTTTLEVLVDGPSALWQVRGQVLDQIVLHWLFLGFMLLLGLICLRRWFSSPLTELMGLIQAHTGAEPFYRLAKEDRTEFARLAEAIAGMLTRLDTTTQRLRKRERAFENLYQSAPAPLVSLDLQGKIVDANQLAAQMLGMVDEKEMIGQQMFQFVRPVDQSLLKHTIDRLNTYQSPRCNIELGKGRDVVNVVVECAGMRDEQGSLIRVRLALLDVSELRNLQSELEDHNHLMKLLINHMSDGIVLIDQDNIVAACNERLALLLHSQPDTFVGKPYDADTFWDELGLVNRDAFLRRIKQVAAEPNRAVRERVDTRVGTFLFQGIPVVDQEKRATAWLWVMTDITSQVKSQKLLVQQTQQLQGLKQLGQKLFEVSSTDDLLTLVGTQLFDIFHVEAIGVALRSTNPQARSRQIIHRGSMSCLLKPHQELTVAIEQNFMHQILSQREVTCWAEMPRSTPWGKAFTRTGLTSLAACPLVGHADPQGVLWIARRGGEHIERHHLYLLEALAPLIASRLEIAQLGNRLSSLQLTDPITGLPNEQHLRYELGKRLKDPEAFKTPSALCVVQLENFEKLCQEVDTQTWHRLLKQIGINLRRHARSSCMVCRLPGARFAVLCSQMDEKGAQMVAQRLQQAVAQYRPKLPDGHAWQLHASLGIVMIPRDGSDPKELLQLAQDRVEETLLAGHLV